MFRDCLYSAFYDWLNSHRETIGDKQYWFFLTELKKSWDDFRTPIHLVALSLWMFMVVSNFGVLAGLEPGNVNVIEIPTHLNEKVTRRVLLNCSSCLALQHLPPEIAKKPLPEGEGPPWRFKLMEYIQAH